MIIVTEKPDNLETNETSWWIVYDPKSKKIVIPELVQMLGKTSSPFTMVVGDTREEIDAYMVENELDFTDTEQDVAPVAS